MLQDLNYVLTTGSTGPVGSTSRFASGKTSTASPVSDFDVPASATATAAAAASVATNSQPQTLSATPSTTAAISIEDFKVNMWLFCLMFAGHVLYYLQFLAYSA